MNLVESLVAGITASTGGDATTASTASRLEMENNQFQLPAGIVRAGAASASLGEFMAKNGATNEEIQQAQTDLLRGLGTDAAQPASELLKSWAVLMAAAPAISAGATAGLASVATGGAIGGTANAMVQRALNGEQEMSRVDVLIAIATGAATQGKSIVTAVATNVSGAGVGAIVKGQALTRPVIATAIGSGVGGIAGKVLGQTVNGIATPAITNAAETTTGSIISEATTSAIQETD